MLLDLASGPRPGDATFALDQADPWNSHADPTAPEEGRTRTWSLSAAGRWALRSPDDRRMTTDAAIISPARPDAVTYRRAADAFRAGLNRPRARLRWRRLLGAAGDRT